MIEWLKFRLSSEAESLAGAYIFGSIIEFGTKPRDLDLILVSRGILATDEWHLTRNLAKLLKKQFSREFEIPLSIIVATKAEWKEISKTIAKGRLTVF